MIKYLSFDDIKKSSLDLSVSNILNEQNRLKAVTADLQGVNVFLSHKHDEPIELIDRVKGFFASQGATTYIDWQDKDMPEITNSETAEKLKKRIRNSKNS